MSLKPIDFQISVPRVYENSKNIQNLKEVVDNQMLIISNNVKNEAEISKKKVNVPKNAEGVKVEREKERGKDNRKENRKKKNGKNNFSSSQNNKTLHIDIRI
ncbi:MAG: hypothetical protein ACPLRZ_04765 [Thermovenabulum sp.]|uniref:hypothetical protein n=1 Tax=Thermovenabulum sp. TaxID=3100335 RepID=UPI003C7BB666